MTIDLEELKRILEMAREHELSEFELERNGFKIRIKKSHAIQTVDKLPAGVPVAASPTPTTAVQPVVPDASSPPAADLEHIDGIELAVVKSPIVGTFFRALEPGARPFVEVGDTVKEGQVLCIIEAMKLMNEIESEYAGQVVSVYVENGHPVQYGERLFAIKARD